MSAPAWDLRGPLPGDAAEERMAFWEAASKVYLDIDHTEGLVPVLEDVLVRAQREKRPGVWGEVQRCLATRSVILGQYDAAKPRLDAALAKVHPDAHTMLYLNLLNLRGLLRKLEGDFAGAVETHAAAIRVVRRQKLRGPGTSSIINLAFTLMQMGSPEQAARVLSDCSDLMEGAHPRVQEKYWAGRLTCAEVQGDLAGARVALAQMESAIAARNAGGEPSEPTSQAILRSLGPSLRLPAEPTRAELVEAGSALLEEALRETKFMPGYRIKAMLGCAQIARRLGNTDLALELARLSRTITLNDLPVRWSTMLEELAAEIHEERGEFQQALVAIRRARSLEKAQFQASLNTTIRSLVDRADRDEAHLRAVELEEVNRALRTTTTRLDAALQEASAARLRAEDAASARHRFLSRMSHELRTPLQGALGAIELLHSTPLDRRQQKFVGILHRSARLTLSVINDILEIGRLEEGRIEIRHDPFDIHAAIEDVLSQVRTRAVSAGVLVTSHIDPELPQRIRGDSRRFTLVLLNLLGNAVKFTQDGSVQVRARLRDDMMLVVDVIDTGCGISEDDLEGIFEPYGQAQKGRPAGVEGAGLGLAIAHGQARAMQGTLTVQSILGEGSTFTLCLPVALLDDAPVHTEAPSDPSARALKDIQILVAEDNPVNQVILTHMIEGMGGHISVVGTGTEALTRLREQHYDIAILDFNMPGMGGLEACQVLRQEGNEIPVIGLTASALPEDSDAARAAQMNAYATKPITREVLKDLVLGLLNP